MNALNNIDSANLQAFANDFQNMSPEAQELLLKLFEAQHREDAKAAKLAKRAQKNAELKAFFDEHKGLKVTLIILGSVIAAGLIVATTVFIVKKINAIGDGACDPTSSMDAPELLV